MRYHALRRIGRGLTVAAAGLALAACSNLLEVQFPGRIPSEQTNDPSLAGVLARSVVSDLECAYNNYSAGSAAHSDEYEASNSNVPGRNWGERTINADEDDYVIGPCETTSYFGMHTTLQTARTQAEDIFTRLSGWTDAQVADRKNLLAIVKTYNGFPYLFMGETFCTVAFDKGPEQPKTAALTLAETKFTEAVALAQAAGNTDMLNLARVGLARTKLDLKKYAEAASVAAQVPVDYVKNADRGTESSRRYNKIFYFMTSNGYHVISQAYRPGGEADDPRLKVFDTGHGAFNPPIRSWQSSKYSALNAPIRLASGVEARLIRAEALAETGDVAGAMALVNAGRVASGLPGNKTAGTTAAAVAIVLAERRAELAFEGGHRLNDVLRRTLPWKGANGSTKIANEFTGDLYGVTTCWPLPTKEKNGA